MNNPDLTRFLWLADAPLFIDAPQVERFYDAVVRPNYVEGATSVTVANSGEVTFGGEVSAEAKFSITGGLLKLFTGADAEVKAGAKGNAAKKDAKSDTRQTQWLPIQTPQRQLGQLILNYNSFDFSTPRLLEYGPSSKAPELFDPATASAPSLPRAIVILDLPGTPAGSQLGGTRLFPMAAELTNGGVTLLYQQLRTRLVEKISALVNKGEFAEVQRLLTDLQPASAGQSSKKSSQMTAGEREQSEWERFAPYFDAWDAMKVLEDAVGQQRIQWIDFQMACPISKGQKNIHLHICPAGAFDTGVFAYNFIFRAYQFGVRIVATLKAGPDLNVLAIYEK
jgi:hypothetical protein